MNRESLLNLFKDCDFEDLSYDNFRYKVINHISKYGYDYDYGLSKLCIIPIEFNYVFKIPFSFDYDYYRINDDGLTEVLLYKKAKQAGLKDCFCKTRVLGKINSQIIYIQEKATIFKKMPCKIIGKCDESSTKILEDYFEEKDVECFNPVWINDAINYYGLNKFNKLINFIKEYEISDLHTENVGYIGERPVLIDFAYCEI